MLVHARDRHLLRESGSCADVCQRCATRRTGHRAGAGHVPLLHAHDDGSHEVRQLPGGPVLGVLPGTDYGEESFALEGDSALVMVTDGVIEGPSLSLDAGLERAGRLAAQALHDGLDAEATADRVLDAAAAVDHLDEVAVLVIRRGDE
ncbi:SpoIIE family protein phosphatase [Streptomyces sp. NPDC002758]